MGGVLHGGALRLCAGPWRPWGSGCFVGQRGLSGEALTLSLDILICEMGMPVPFQMREERQRHSAMPLTRTRPSERCFALRDLSLRYYKCQFSSADSLQ